MSSYTPQVGDWYVGKSSGTSGASGYYRWNGSNWQWNGRSQPTGTQVDPATKQPLSSGSGGSGVSTSTTINLQLRNPSVNAGSPSAGSLRYPVDPAIAADSDYVLFEFFKYRPPFGRGAGESSAAPSGTSGYDLYQASNERSYNSPSDLKPILLYMPEDISVEFGADWAGVKFSATQTGLARATGTQISALPAGLQSIPGAAKNATFDAMREAINKATGGSISLNQLLGGVTGTVVNPNVEMMYDAPKIRNFSLKFKMAPRSSTEAGVIRQICNRFRKAMLPTFGGQALFGTVQNAPNLLTIPDLCQVTYMKGNDKHTFLPAYKLCAITNVSINYTPDGSYATYSDGSPVATELTISFSETKLIFSQEVQETGGAY